jgi:hypothetical protein
MTYAERIRATQDEYERETGERPSFNTAAVILDRRADAEYHRAPFRQADLNPEALRPMTPAANLADLNARNVEAETLRAWRGSDDPTVSAIAKAEQGRREPLGMPDPCYCDGPWSDIEPENRPETVLEREHVRGWIVNELARCKYAPPAYTEPAGPSLAQVISREPV